MALPRSSITTLNSKTLFSDGDNQYIFTMSEVGDGRKNRFLMDLRLFQKGKPTREGVCLVFNEMAWLLNQVYSDRKDTHEGGGRFLVCSPTDGSGDVILELKQGFKESRLVFPENAIDALVAYLLPPLI